jgi:hypothetical protein
MADSSKDFLYGFGIGSVVVVSVLTLALIIAFAYFLNIKDIIIYIYYNITIFFRLFFINNASIPESDICSIVPSDKNVPRIPSLFIAHVSFFFGFLLANAIYLYEYKNDDITNMENYLNNRKYRIGTSIFLLLTIFLFIVFVRYKTTNCESLAGILFTAFVFGYLKASYLTFFKFCNY